MNGIMTSEVMFALYMGMTYDNFLEKKFVHLSNIWLGVGTIKFKGRGVVKLHRITMVMTADKGNFFFNKMLFFFLVLLVWWMGLIKGQHRRPRRHLRAPALDVRVPTEEEDLAPKLEALA